MPVASIATCVHSFAANHSDELVARIHAIVRRSKGHAQSVVQTGVEPLRRLNSSSIWYSLPVRCTRAPPTSTVLASAC
jgi:hypothetical protein